MHGPVGPRPADAAAGKQPPLRLTRRGRVVFFGIPLMLLAALMLSLSGFLNAPAKAADSAADLSLTPTVSVTVQPGESLWAIAEPSRRSAIPATSWQISCS